MYWLLFALFFIGKTVCYIATVKIAIMYSKILWLRSSVNLDGYCLKQVKIKKRKNIINEPWYIGCYKPPGQGLSGGILNGYSGIN